jgi:antitoxin VapB
MIYISEVSMPRIEKTEIFGSGRSQAIRIPVEFRFNMDEVYIRRDEQTGDLILSQAPGDWAAIFAALETAGIPDDFLVDRAQSLPQKREGL